jgi:hypothetical protein
MLYTFFLVAALVNCCEPCDRPPHTPAIHVPIAFRFMHVVSLQAAFVNPDLAMAHSLLLKQRLFPTTTCSRYPR